MSQTDLEVDALLRECQDIAARLLAQRDWKLLAAEQLAQRALAFLRDTPTTVPEQAAHAVYSQALYAACAPGADAQQQALGYQDLLTYLHSSARRSYPDCAEDAAQQALTRVFELFDQCRSPTSFIAFAYTQLKYAARQIRRSSARELYDQHIEQLADPQYDDMDTQLLKAELRAQVRALEAAFLLNHPRGSTQFAALRLKYIDDLTDLAISERLGKTIGNVYVLRLRAIDRLRDDPDWRALADQLDSEV